MFYFNIMNTVKTKIASLQKRGNISRKKRMTNVEKVKLEIAKMKKEFDELRPNFKKITQKVKTMKKTDEKRLIDMLQKYPKKKLLAYVYKKSTRDPFLQSWRPLLPMLNKNQLITLLLNPVQNVKLTIDFSKNNNNLKKMISRGDSVRKKRNITKTKKTPIVRVASGKTPPQNKWTHDI